MSALMVQCPLEDHPLAWRVLLDDLKASLGEGYSDYAQQWRDQSSLAPPYDYIRQDEGVPTLITSGEGHQHWPTMQERFTLLLALHAGGISSRELCEETSAKHLVRWIFPSFINTINTRNIRVQRDEDPETLLESSVGAFANRVLTELDERAHFQRDKAQLIELVSSYIYSVGQRRDRSMFVHMPVRYS